MKRQAHVASTSESQVFHTAATKGHASVASASSRQTSGKPPLPPTNHSMTSETSHFEGSTPAGRRLFAANTPPNTNPSATTADAAAAVAASETSPLGAFWNFIIFQKSVVLTSLDKELEGKTETVVPLSAKVAGIIADKTGKSIPRLLHQCHKALIQPDKHLVAGTEEYRSYQDAYAALTNLEKNHRLLKDLPESPPSFFVHDDEGGHDDIIHVATFDLSKVHSLPSNGALHFDGKAGLLLAVGDVVDELDQVEREVFKPLGYTSVNLKVTSDDKEIQECTLYHKSAAGANAAGRVLSLLMRASEVQVCKDNCKVEIQTGINTDVDPVTSLPVFPIRELAKSLAGVCPTSCSFTGFRFPATVSYNLAFPINASSGDIACCVLCFDRCALESPLTLFALQPRGFRPHVVKLPSATAAKIEDIITLVDGGRVRKVIFESVTFKKKTDPIIELLAVAKKKSPGSLFDIVELQEITSAKLETLYSESSVLWNRLKASDANGDSKMMEMTNAELAENMKQIGLYKSKLYGVLTPYGIDKALIFTKEGRDAWDALDQQGEQVDHADVAILESNPNGLNDLLAEQEGSIPCQGCGFKLQPGSMCLTCNVIAGGNTQDPAGDITEEGSNPPNIEEQAETEEVAATDDDSGTATVAHQPHQEGFQLIPNSGGSGFRFGHVKEETNDIPSTGGFEFHSGTAVVAHQPRQEGFQRMPTAQPRQQDLRQEEPDAPFRNGDKVMYTDQQKYTILSMKKRVKIVLDTTPTPPSKWVNVESLTRWEGV